MDKFIFQFDLSNFLLNLPLIIMRERICFKNHESEKAQNIVQIVLLKLLHVYNL